MSVASQVRWEELAQSLIVPIVGHPEAVKITVDTSGRQGVVIRAKVHPDDAGRVIGSRGSTLSVINQLVEFTAKRHGLAATLLLADG